MPAIRFYAPDWIPQPDGVSLAAWDRYWNSQPGSDEHKAAYAGMHREAKGKGFPGPDPEQSYLADHGYGTGADRDDPGEDYAKPDDAYLCVPRISSAAVTSRVALLAVLP